MKIPTWLRTFFDFILRRNSRRVVTPPPLDRQIISNPNHASDLPPVKEPESDVSVTETFVIEPIPTSTIPEPPDSAAPAGQNEESSNMSEPPEPEPVKVSANRNERRRLERLRRKHDKFVQPKGPLAKPVSRPAKIKPKPRRSTVVIEDEDDSKDAELLIADKHHEDRKGEDVLYKEAEFYGEFNFRDTILQQLERYFVYLARMKKHDPQSYALYRQIGATILPYFTTGADHHDDAHNEEQKLTLPLWFHNTRPAFGCYAYGADPETEKFESTKVYKEDKDKVCWVPKFMYYTKFVSPPPQIQPMSGGDIYMMTIWWDRPFDPKVKNKNKYGVPQKFGIFISSDGKQVVALKKIDTEMLPIYSKRKHEHFYVPKRAWHLPSEFETWAKEEGKDPQVFLTDIFLRSVLTTELAQYSMARIAATKNDMTAVFSVNIHRMGYFFQDRDIHLNQTGSRKRIFHIVRAHTRKDGSVVPFHFRGERNFTWAGYPISITIPGRDHLNINDFDVGAEDDYWVTNRKNLLGSEELGKQLSDMIREGLPRA